MRFATGGMLQTSGHALRDVPSCLALARDLLLCHQLDYPCLAQHNYITQAPKAAVRATN